jgi:hypothetical protein
MRDMTKDIQSRPVVLRVKCHAEAVVPDAEAKQRLLDIAARADVYEGIRQGLDDVAHAAYARQNKPLMRFTAVERSRPSPLCYGRDPIGHSDHHPYSGRFKVGRSSFDSPGLFSSVGATFS